MRLECLIQFEMLHSIAQRNTFSIIWFLETSVLKATDYNHQKLHLFTTKGMFHSHNRAVIHQLEVVTMMGTCVYMEFDIRLKKWYQYHIIYLRIHFCSFVCMCDDGGRIDSNELFLFRFVYLMCQYFYEWQHQSPVFPMFFFASLIFMSPPTALLHIRPHYFRRTEQAQQIVLTNWNIIYSKYSMHKLLISDSNQ